MKKTAITLLLTVFLAVSAPAQVVDINHFLKSPSVNGISGYIINPSAYTIPHLAFSMALHKFVFTANVGFYDIGEAGIIFDFGGSSDFGDILKSGGINLKVRVLKEEDAFVSLSAGIERLQFNIFDSPDSEIFKGYIVASKKIDDMSFSLGVKKKLRAEEIDFLMLDFMANASKIINETILLIAEYDTDGFNAGIKISLNYNISVEVFVAGLGRLNDSPEFSSFLDNHFIFGITYLQ